MPDATAGSVPPPSTQAKLSQPSTPAQTAVMQKPQAESSPSVLDEVASILKNKTKTEITPEALLEADGDLNVSAPDETYDPAQAHLQARSHVDTSRKNKQPGLKPHFDPELSEKDDKTFRVVKVAESDAKAQSREYAEESTPTETVNDIEAPVSSRPVPPVSTLPVETVPEVADPSVVVPLRKPRAEVAGRSVAGEVVPAVSEGDEDVAAIIPRRKPAVAVARVEPEAGETRAEAIAPDRKPPVSPKEEPREEKVVKADADSPKPTGFLPKTAFKPVKLKALREEDTGMLSSSPQAAQILRMRSGEHSGRTRIVLEVRGDVRFEAQLDNSSKLLRVDIEGASWDISDSVTFHKLSIVKGFRLERLSGGGVELLLELKKDTKLLQATSLAAEEPGITRIIIDLRNG